MSAPKHTAYCNMTSFVPALRPMMLQEHNKYLEVPVC